MSLGHRIRQLRQARGLTQAQIGGAELSKSFISLLEKDRTRPSLATLQLLARRLDASVDTLLGQTGHVPEGVADGLLALCREALRNRDYGGAKPLIEAVRFLVGKYALQEASLELSLQEAQMALDQRQFGEAHALAASGYQTSLHARDFWRAGRARVIQGWAYLRQRDIPKAVEAFDEALQILRRARAGRDAARIDALIGLGGALVYSGDFSIALARYQEAARSDVAAHNLKLRGQAHWGIGVAARKMGDWETAQASLGQARDAFEQAEDLENLMRVLQNLGQLLAEQHQPKDALRHLHLALRVAERLSRPMDRASVLTEIARVHAALRNLSDAEHFGHAALRQAEETGDLTELAAVKVVLAEVAAERKQFDRAATLLKDAVTVYRERKMRAKLADAARRLGLLLRARGAHAQAADYLALSIEHGGKADIGRPKDLVEIPD